MTYESTDLLLHVRLVAAGLAVALVPGLALAAVDAAGAGGAPGTSLHRLKGAPARRISVALRRGGGHAPSVDAARAAIGRAVAEQLSA